MDHVQGFLNKSIYLNFILETKNDAEMDIDNKDYYIGHHDSFSLKKFAVFIKKSLELLKILLQNPLGQNLILFSENHSVVPRSSKPILYFNHLIGLMINLIDNSTNVNDFYFHILEIFDAFGSMMVHLFYDLIYFENSQSMITHDNIFTSIWSKNRKIMITDIRLNNIITMLLGENTQIDGTSLKSAQETIKDLERTILHTELLVEKSIASSPELISNKSKIKNKLTSIKNSLSTLINCLNINELVIINTQNSNDFLKNPKLPISRKIPEKCEIIKKYYNFYCSQNYGSSMPVQNKNEFKNQIFEFEKLLNWKKYRILLSKMDYIVLRTSHFDLDNNLKFTRSQGSKLDLPSEFTLNTYHSKKKRYYINNESFEQFFNQFMNEELTVMKFSNISYFIHFSKINNNPQLIELFDHKYNLEFSIVNQAKNKIEKSTSNVKSNYNLIIFREKNQL